ncbi:hypothetical protein [Streptomyces sp. NPDC005799]|uniref:hypothetical protein n=1 Tax=Streptomyces sp. NPDC005799 TaxID=3154678 RepID=UPI003405D5FC
MRLSDGPTALSQRLGAPLAAPAAVYLTVAPKDGRNGPTAGDAYVAVELGLTVEVLRVRRDTRS